MYAKLEKYARAEIVWARELFFREVRDVFFKFDIGTFFTLKTLINSTEMTLRWPS